MAQSTGIKERPTEPIRILCVFSLLDRGGAETMCMNLYRRIDRSQVQFDFVKHTEVIGEYEEEIRALGGRIFLAPQYTIINHMAYCHWWKHHFQAHPEHRIIHGHYYTLSAIYFRIAKQYGRYTVAHSHSTSVNSRFPLKYAAKYLIPRSRKYADTFLACSEAAGKWMFSDHPFTVVHNAVDSASFRIDLAERSAVRKEFGIHHYELVVGIIGRLVAIKNPFEAVQIFKEIRKRQANSRLLWVGEGGLRPEIEKKLAEENVSDAAILTGSREDVPRLLQAMDALILPSFREGLGVVAIEGQAAGLRCFISDTVPQEVNVTGRCTFLPLGMPQLWADAILSADLTKADTQQQIVEAGYDIQAVCEWLQNFYLTESKKLKS